jgi:hypothetical protein
VEPTSQRTAVAAINAVSATTTLRGRHRVMPSAWIAPPGAMKLAPLAQAAICVGAGLDWHGYLNKGAAGVVYFAIERADLVKRRFARS